MGIFHDTTRVAIREMIEEFGDASRFGRVLSEEDLEAAAGRIASFLEMTLELRSGLGSSLGLGRTPSPAPLDEAPRARTNALPPRRTGPGLDAGYTEKESPSERPSVGFARTRAAADIVAEHALTQGAGTGSGRKDGVEARLAVQHDLRLPRTRVSASDDERDVFARIRGEKR